MEIGRSEVPGHHVVVPIGGPVGSRRSRRMSVRPAQELIVPEGPLKKFEFKKGGENYWQEGSEMFEQDKVTAKLHG